MSVEQIRVLISTGKLDKALAQMLKLIGSDSDHYSTIILLNGQYNSNEKGNRMGTLTNAEYSRTRNHISFSALEILNDIKGNAGVEDIPAVIEPTIEEGPYPPGGNKDDGITTVVFLASNPLQNARLQLEKEYSRINQKVNRADHFQKFRIVWHNRITPASFRDHLKLENLDIVHFSGHGDKTGVEIKEAMTRAGRLDIPTTAKAIQSGIWLLEEDDNAPLYVSAAFVKRVFKSAQKASNKSIKAVVFNACHSDDIAKAVSQEVEYVVGTSWEVGDDAAIAFAQAFYDTISDSVAKTKKIDIETAVDEGITAAMAYNEPEDRFRLYKNGELVEL